jgi:hypothetical protein
MLDSMITAVDDGFSYDGIVSIPETGLEDVGRRPGLAGWLDGSVVRPLLLLPSKTITDDGSYDSGAISDDKSSHFTQVNHFSLKFLPQGRADMGNA